MNFFHIIVFALGIFIVFTIAIIAGFKELRNEKFWIAFLAFIGFSTYILIDYDFEKHGFRNPAPRPCNCSCQMNEDLKKVKIKE